MFRGQTMGFLTQQSWRSLVGSTARSRTNRRRLLEDDDRATVIAALDRILATAWLPMFAIMAHPDLPTFVVETQVRRLLDELSTGPDARYRSHQVPDALPANYWTVAANTKPFGPGDIIIRHKRRDRDRSRDDSDD